MTIRREIRWLEQSQGGPLRWNQRFLAIDGADEISRLSDRESSFAVAEQFSVDVPTVAVTSVEKSDAEHPTHTVMEHTVRYESQTFTRPKYKYDSVVREKLDTAVARVWTTLRALFGGKWPVEHWHYDIATQQCQFRLRRTIDTVSDTVIEMTSDSSVIAACEAAAGEVSQILTQAEGHPIALVDAPEPSAPAPEGDISETLETEHGAPL